MACMSKTIAACFAVLLSFVNPCVVGAQEKADHGCHVHIYTFVSFSGSTIDVDPI